METQNKTTEEVLKIIPKTIIVRTIKLSGIINGYVVLENGKAIKTFKIKNQANRFRKHLITEKANNLLNKEIRSLKI